jgi:hypothetical protein
MKTGRFTAMIAGLALMALTAFAQSPSSPKTPATQPAAASVIPSDQQATKEQIEKLFEVMRLKKQMQSMMGMMPQIILQSFQAQMKNINETLPPGKRLMPQDQAALEKVMNKYMQRATEVYPVDEMIADAIPVYQRHISRTDADAVIAFYSSSAGQRILEEQPAIMSEYMAIVTGHMQDLMKPLADEMKAEMQEIVKPDLTEPGASSGKPN